MDSESFISKDERANSDPENYENLMYKDDAYKNANFISKIFFYWTVRILRLAKKTTLKPEYLGNLEGSHKSMNYLKDFNYIWENKKYKNIKSNRIFKTILRTNLKSIIFLFILSVFSMGFDIMQIVLYRDFIKSFEKPDNLIVSAKYIGWFFLMNKLFSILLKPQPTLLQNYLGYKTVGQLNCFIFNKILRESPASTKGKSNQGEIINFLQIDSMKIAMMMTGGTGIFIIPIQIIVYTYMLFDFLGVSFIFGFITLAIFLIINFFMTSRSRMYMKQYLKKVDTRMKLTTEAVNSLKIIKLYTWEDEFLRKINEARKEELGIRRSMFNISAINLFLLWLAPIMVSTVSIGVYQALVKKLYLSSMLACITIFNSIQEPIRNLPWTINIIMECIVSLKRIEKYLDQDEVDESRLIKDDLETKRKDVAIFVKNGTFSWGRTLSKEEHKKKKDERKEKEESKEKDSLNKSSISMKSMIGKNLDDSLLINPPTEDKEEEEEEMKPSLKNINLTVKKGEFLGVIGEVGSGKSSLFQAILNNMLVFDEDVTDPTRICINGKVAYISQTPFIQNTTLKNNILFYSEYIDSKYEKILELSELKQDLESLAGGDMTEIGEKGINLSGGQKARVAIARALYSDSDIYLFDDPISALDSHVGQNIMNNVINGYLKEKTRVLITHAIQYLSMCDRIIAMKNKEIVFDGTYQELVKQEFFEEYVHKVQKSPEEKKETDYEKKIDSEDEDSKKKDRKVSRITKDEVSEKGKVKLSVYLKYISYNGGFLTAGVVLLTMIIWQGLKGGSDIWLTIWTKDQNKSKNNYYFMIYSILGIGSSIFIFFRVFILTRNSLKCSKRIHEDMISNMVGAPINLYHDVTPKGQILNRFSKDLSSVDTYMVFMYGNFNVYMVGMLGCITVSAIFMPFSLAVLPIVCVLGFFTLRFYMSASRDLSRLDGVTRSPLLNCIGETLNGAVTIRAFGYQSEYRKLFCDRFDTFYKIRIFTNGVSCWFSLCLDFYTWLFFFFLIMIFTFQKEYFNAASVGLVISYSIQLQSFLNTFLYNLANLENGMVAFERCSKYTEIAQEKPALLDSDSKLKEWPSQGKVEFRNYSVKYRPETNLVLKNLNFTFLPGERIGVVGRTGSGKSTLCLTIFRILEPETGSIYIDGVDITNVGLKTLRSKLTIIPQDPILMEGTLKYNIDPMQIYEDSRILEVIKRVGFEYLLENNELGLEMPITDNGGNLSVGERQLICIARAILRKSKIILMDEATANIDVKTEEIIQKAINELLKGATIITIAHRIKTILTYDKILVLSEGEVVEFDSLQTLISNQNSEFYKFYSKSS